ncbi:hypothetical protein BDW59DRAFT_154317 [Aspergillus cavernicola]|uniref:Uncharacterized protein n=1 Tax=Aspergillus cavernicola TaxID=176166 RepID=A0ABR4HHA3_9EURO
MERIRINRRNEKPRKNSDIAPCLVKESVENDKSVGGPQQMAGPSHFFLPLFDRRPSTSSPPFDLSLRLRFSLHSISLPLCFSNFISHSYSLLFFTNKPSLCRLILIVVLLSRQVSDNSPSLSFHRLPLPRPCPPLQRTPITVLCEFINRVVPALSGCLSWSYLVCL